jgi:hypothetical protein
MGSVIVVMPFISFETKESSMTAETIALLGIYRMDSFAMCPIAHHTGYLFLPGLDQQLDTGSPTC